MWAKRLSRFRFILLYVIPTPGSPDLACANTMDRGLSLWDGLVAVLFCGTGGADTAVDEWEPLGALNFLG